MFCYDNLYIIPSIDPKELCLEKFLHVVIGHHLLIKDVGTCLGALNHFDNLGIRTSFCLTCLEGSNRFLCHNLNVLLNFLMYGHSLQNGVVLLQFKSLRCVLTVFGSNVTRCSGESTLFHLCAFKDNLHSVSFYFLCHNVYQILKRLPLYPSSRNNRFLRRCAERRQGQAC